MFACVNCENNNKKKSTLEIECISRSGSGSGKAREGIERAGEPEHIHRHLYENTSI